MSRTSIGNHVNASKSLNVFTSFQYEKRPDKKDNLTAFAFDSPYGDPRNFMAYLFQYLDRSEGYTTKFYYIAVPRFQMKNYLENFIMTCCCKNMFIRTTVTYNATDQAGAVLPFRTRLTNMPGEGITKCVQYTPPDLVEPGLGSMVGSDTVYSMYFAILEIFP